MKTEKSWYVGGLEWLIQNAWIELPHADKERLMHGRELLKRGHCALVPFNHLAFPDPPFITALLLHHWGGDITSMQFPTSQKFYDGRMGRAGKVALRLADKLEVGMPPIIQAGDPLYSPQEQERVNNTTMYTLQQTLQTDGGVVSYAPEGTRSRNGKLIPALGFADMLGHDIDFAYTSKVFVQPIALWGTEKLWGIGKVPRPFSRVHIRVGEAMFLAQLKEEARQYNFAAINKMEVPGKKRRGIRPVGDTILLHIARMLPPEYRGVYGDLVS